ncbi:MAG: GNAT family N-acetyltransferase [Anaerolineae bacterium]|nr:GNAT family N-acetyltransferase [Anaerolineae bacterium]
MEIRDFTSDDYAGIVAVRNAIYPDRPIAVADVQHWDARYQPSHRQGRWLAEAAGQIIAWAEYGQNAWEEGPHTYFIDCQVLPERQGQGIGGALYTTVLDALLPLEPRQLKASVRSDQRPALAFAEKCGFQETHRHSESRLDVQAFDPAPFAGAEEWLRAAGITIHTLAELADDPERDRKLYACDCEVSQDVPEADSFTLPAFDEWLKDVINHPRQPPEAFFVAMAGDQVVGFTSLLTNRTTRHLLHNGFTAVRRDYRRRGIALALKLRGIEFARAYGCHHIETGNEVRNGPMLALNNRLGFVPGPDWVSFTKHL